MGVRLKLGGAGETGSCMSMKTPQKISSSYGFNFTENTVFNETAKNAGKGHISTPYRQALF